ncbi:MAG TPA: DUF983 domain-containing protein [Methylomirabilota bacterium]|nr:DUF983 domain-containing protein [Methylomirabilota bacterium]
MPREGRAGRLARALGRAARLSCPRCGGTRLFVGRFTMARSCALCGLVFERAQGYFVGAIYLNYAATALIVMGGYLTLWRLTTLSPAAQLALWVPVAIVFPLWFFRYSRSFWLALEYALNPEP